MESKNTEASNYWENVNDLLKSHLNADVGSIILKYTKQMIERHVYECFLQKLKDYEWYSDFYKEPYTNLMIIILLHELFKKYHIMGYTINGEFQEFKSNGMHINNDDMICLTGVNEFCNYQYWIENDEKSYNVIVDIPNSTWYNINITTHGCNAWYHRMPYNIEFSDRIQKLYESNPDTFWKIIIEKRYNKLFTEPFCLNACIEALENGKCRHYTSYEEKKRLLFDSNKLEINEISPYISYFKNAMKSPIYHLNNMQYNTFRYPRRLYINKIEDIDVGLLKKLNRFRDEMLSDLFLK